MHAVALVVGIPHCVGDQPHVGKAAPLHGDGQQFPDGAASAVASEDVRDVEVLDRFRAIARPDSDPYLVGVLFQREQPCVETGFDIGAVAQLLDQYPLQVGLGEGVLERVPEPLVAEAAGVHEGSATDVEVLRSRAGHDDRVDRPVDAGRLQRAQRLVVQTDRLGVVARCRIALDDQDAYAE